MKASLNLKGIIFDLDGTLGNTLPICFTAFRGVFFKYLNRNFTDEEISSYFGSSEEGIIKKLVEQEWQDCLKMYLDEYEKAHFICDKPFAGVETALSLCKEKNIALAIVTGKGQYSAAISLRYLGLKDYFDIVESGSASGGIKPLAIKKVLVKWNISPQFAAYVGDSPSDIIDAKESGVIPLAAAWAQTANYERLEAMSPVEIFRTVENFIYWLGTYCNK